MDLIGLLTILLVVLPFHSSRRLLRENGSTSSFLAKIINPKNIRRLDLVMKRIISKHSWANLRILGLCAAVKVARTYANAGASILVAAFLWAFWQLGWVWPGLVSADGNASFMRQVNFLALCITIFNHPRAREW